MTQIMASENKGLVFEIISARIAEQEAEKKHVIYSLQIRYISENDDLNPSIIERRYTHFLDLYNALKKEYPNLMTNVTFPKKVLLGNFNNELISTRSTGFESLLKHISTVHQLRNSHSLLAFLQDVELNEAKSFFRDKGPLAAYPLLENSLKLLNKVYTDRYPAVLLALIRLVACTETFTDFPDVFKYSDLALHRYEGVSDNYLLELYVPLLQTCVKLWCQNGRNIEEIERRLANLQKQGVKISETTSLMDAVDNVEQKILNISTAS